MTLIKTTLPVIAVAGGSPQQYWAWALFGKRRTGSAATGARPR